MTEKITVYDASNAGDLRSAKSAMHDALALVDTTPPETLELVPSQAAPASAFPVQAPASASSRVRGKITITPNPELLGIDPSTYDLINQSLSVKRHLMFYGPPGTGKTSLAEYVAAAINGDAYVMVTGTSDWTSQDIIGGYQPTGQGRIKFVPGLILEHFDKPIVIDELNRVDIDKAIGPLFTVLSGQETTLPYQLEPDSADPARHQRVHILPVGAQTAAIHQFAPTEDWRLIATMNSLDKAYLYQMSYALSRRFAWILIDVPQNLNGFVVEYLVKQQIIAAAPQQGTDSILAAIWAAVNEIRPIGAAPFIDFIRFCKESDPQFNFFSDSPDEVTQRLYLNGFYTFVLPLLDGILLGEAEKISEQIQVVINLPASADLALQMVKRIIYHSI
jgi:5-methylcytosine-specific restriction protein B